VKRKPSGSHGDKIAIDTNVLVRYFTWDDEKQGHEAAHVIESAATVLVSTIVLCELVWVLRRAYRYTAKEIHDLIRRLAQTRTVELDRPATEAGLAMLAKGGDFADGVIAYETHRAKCDRLVTFDRQLVRAGDSAKIEFLGSAQA
jgi:predicted nucleic-acid-binding protein